MDDKDTPIEESSENTFWDEYDMVVIPIVKEGEILEQFNSRGEKEIVRRAGKIVWVAGGSFTKMFPLLEDVLKKITQIKTRRLVDYIVFNIKKDCDYIDFDLDKLVDYCGLANKKGIYAHIKNLIKLKILLRAKGHYHRYFVNPYMIYSGVYPEDRIEEGKKRKAEKKEKNEKAPNTDFTKTDTY